MAKERSSVVLVLIGILWLVIAGVWGYQLYNPLYSRLPSIITYGLSALIAGLFLGRALQRAAHWRVERAAARVNAATKEPPSTL